MRVRDEVVGQRLVLFYTTGIYGGDKPLLRCSQTIEQRFFKLIPVEIGLVEDDFQAAVTSIWNRLARQFATDPIEQQPFIPHIKNAFEPMHFETSIEEFKQIDFPKAVNG